jgi:hypothetical protein
LDEEAEALVRAGLRFCSGGIGVAATARLLCATSGSHGSYAERQASMSRYTVVGDVGVGRGFPMDAWIT